MRKKVTVLILAHKGVQNPEVWEKWSHLDPSHPVQLYALCENHSQDSVCKNFGITGSVRVLPSKWCGGSIALNTLAALRHVAQDPSVAIIYLVSGVCLPLVHPSVLYRKAVRLPSGHVDAGKIWRPLQNTLTVVEKLNDVLTCTQWISLEPKTIRKLKDDPTLLKQTENIYPDSCPPERRAVSGHSTHRLLSRGPQIHKPRGVGSRFSPTTTDRVDNKELQKDGCTGDL